MLYHDLQTGMQTALGRFRCHINFYHLVALPSNRADFIADQTGIQLLLLSYSARQVINFFK